MSQAQDNHGNDPITLVPGPEKEVAPVRYRVLTVRSYRIVDIDGIR